MQSIPSYPHTAQRELRAPGSGPLGLSPTAWVKIIVVAVLFVALYRFNLVRLWEKTKPFYGQANWQHSIIVPIVGLYYLFVRRDELLATPVVEVLPQIPSRSQLLSAGITILAGVGLYLLGPIFAAPLVKTFSVAGDKIPAILKAIGVATVGLGVLALFLNWGLAFLIGGLIFGSYGIWPGQNDYVWDLGMVLTLFGTVLTLCGWGIMRIAWFPIVFLICALPWPELVYQMLAWPLQLLASKVAVVSLNIFQVEATVQGTKIVMPTGRALNVAEACAGLRSLMTFISLGAAVAFLSDRPLWEKFVVTASAVPIAIFCNVLRVSGMGLLDFYVDQEFSEGFAHQFAGLVSYIPAIFLLIGVMWVLDHLFVEEADGEDDLPPPALAAPEAR